MLIIDQDTPEVDLMVLFPLLPCQDLVQSIINKAESDQVFSVEIVSVKYPTESGPAEFESWIRCFGNYSNIIYKNNG